jgi:3',5'-cyclic AMP phosphodiesterase CpdA
VFDRPGESMSRDHESSSWCPWELSSPLPERKLSQSLLSQLIWNIEFPILLAAAGSVGIGSALGVASILYRLFTAASELFEFRFFVPWWIWIVVILGGYAFSGQAINIIRFSPMFITGIILFPLEIAKGLRAFIFERLLYTLGGDLIPFWLECVLRSLFLIVLSFVSILLFIAGANLIPDLFHVYRDSFLNIKEIPIPRVSHPVDMTKNLNISAWLLIYLKLFLAGFPSFLAFGFSYGFAVNPAYQFHDLWNALKGARVSSLTLTDAVAVASVSKMTIAHLSDLHLTEESDTQLLEGDHGDPIANFLRASADLTQRIDEIDLVLITGDITDSGVAREWQHFFEGLSPNVMQKTIILPGNHDLNITDKYSIWRAETNMFASRTIRLIRFACAMDLIQGHKCNVLDDTGTLVLLADYLAKNRDAMLEYVKTGDYRGCDPTKIWQHIFPMILDLPLINATMFILDSNDISANLIDNAFGLVEADQMRRLIRLFPSYADRKQVFALHHHVALPRSLRARSPKDRLFEKFMVLRNSRSFINALLPTRETIIFHGHRHVDYRGSVGLAQVVSAPSTTLGSIVPARPPGYYIYTLGCGPNAGVAIASTEFVNLS